MDNLPQFLVSSKGYGLAIRWQAVLVGLIPSIIFIAEFFGVSLAKTEILQLVQSFTLLIAVFMFLYGAIRNIIYRKRGLGKFEV